MEREIPFDSSKHLYKITQKKWPHSYRGEITLIDMSAPINPNLTGEVSRETLDLIRRAESRIRERKEQKREKR